MSDSRVFRGPITQLALWVTVQWALGALQTSSVTILLFLFPFFSLLFLPLGAQPKPLWAPGPSTLWRVTPPPSLHAPDDNNDNNLVCFDKSVTDGQTDRIANCRLTLACQYLNYAKIVIHFLLFFHVRKKQGTDRQMDRQTDPHIETRGPI